MDVPSRFRQLGDKKSTGHGWREQGPEFKPEAFFNVGCGCHRTSSRNRRRTSRRSKRAAPRSAPKPHTKGIDKSIPRSKQQAQKEESEKKRPRSFAARGHPFKPIHPLRTRISRTVSVFSFLGLHSHSFPPLFFAALGKPEPCAYIARAPTRAILASSP